MLKITSFEFRDPTSRGKYEAFIDGFFDSLMTEGVRDLILDLRGNGGGDPYCAAFLFARLIAEDTPYFAAQSPGYSDLKMILPARNRFDGRVYTLIDGGCFSTTGHLCSLLRYHGIGTFIGEETCGSFACTDAKSYAILDHTGLILRVSTQVYTTAVTGMTPGRGILPDHPVIPTVEERLAHFDAPMGFALGLIGGRGQAGNLLGPNETLGPASQ